jgi:type II secretory pathway pseudopilin PulG
VSTTEPSTTPPQARNWWKPATLATALLALLLVFVGYALGSADSSKANDRADNAQHTAAEQIQAAKDETGRLQAQLSSARDLAKREAAADLSSREQALAAATKSHDDKVAADTAALAAREAAVTGVEKAKQANTIPGDGTYLVGADIQAGTYKSAGGELCYWARQGAGEKILANDIASNGGQSVVTVRATDVSLRVSGCAEFVRQ